MPLKNCWPTASTLACAAQPLTTVKRLPAARALVATTFPAQLGAARPNNDGTENSGEITAKPLLSCSLEMAMQTASAAAARLVDRDLEVVRGDGLRDGRAALLHGLDLR